MGYKAWVSDGRPILPAQPIEDLVGQLKQAYPKAQSMFGWYANAAHYQAAEPGDHTPYSADPWPAEPNPYPYVFATDVMHRPNLGVDCQVLVAYWLEEARAGRMPWLKYVIWQGHIYDVRRDWRRQDASDHRDHAHVSARTDHRDTRLGSWSAIPPGGTDMATAAEAQQALIDAWRLDALQTGSETVRGGPLKGEKMWIVTAIKTLTRSVADVAATAAAIGTNTPEVAVLLAGVQTQLDDQTTALKATVASTVADLGEGGAALVRRHAAD